MASALFYPMILMKTISYSQGFTSKSFSILLIKIVVNFKNQSKSPKEMITADLIKKLYWVTVVFVYLNKSVVISMK